MQVNRISNITFESAAREKGKRYVSEYAQQGAEKLLQKMNHETQYRQDPSGMTWTSNILASINIGKDIKFYDDRNYLYPVKQPIEHEVDCSLLIGKNRLDINSKTGEVVRYRKTVFTFWGKLLKQAENCINELLVSFDNPEVVNKNMLPLKGYTKEGLAKLQKYI